jgi:hypothetical protein
MVAPISSIGLARTFIMTQSLSLASWYLWPHHCEIGIVRGLARAGPYHGGRAWPLRQLQETLGGVGVLPYLPPE